MKAFYFGRSGRQIYGAYESPAGKDIRRGAVFCNAVGAEYYAAHRACRSLAQRIAAKGAHSLRFDYLGTGDSSGEVADFELTDWIDSVSQAIAELKDMTGLARVSLVGLRLGAAIASHASRDRGDVASLVLWDPLQDPAESPEMMSPKEFPLLVASGLRALRWPRPGEQVTPTVLVRTDGPPLPRGHEDKSGFGATQGYRSVTHLGPAAWIDSSEDFGGGGLPVAALDEIAGRIASS